MKKVCWRSDSRRFFGYNVGKMAYLKRISIKGFRSIKEADIELGLLNVLIGANGSGKSNFIAFFKMLNEVMARNLGAYVGASGSAEAILYLGPKTTSEIDAEIEFEAKFGTMLYRIRLVYAADDSLVFAEDSPYMISEDRKRTLLQDFGSGHRESKIANGELGEVPSFRQALSRYLCRPYHFHDTSPTAAIRRHGHVGDNHQLRPDAGNLAAMLYAYRQTSDLVYRRIVSAIRKILPEFDDFDLQPDRLNPNEIALAWRRVGADYQFGPHQFSDGSLRAMAILTLLLQPEKELPDVIILDEPELGLHPYAIAIIAGLLRAASISSQVIVATQSQAFLDHFAPSEIVVVDADKNGSHFKRLEEEELKDWLADYSIGELWDKNVIGGGPLS
jgi:predicted ATPase